MNGSQRRLSLLISTSLLLAIGCASSLSPAEIKGLTAVDEREAANRTRLEQLWQQRMDPAGFADPDVRAGDLLEISVPGLSELEAVRARVARDGAILLPLLGRVPAAGLTELELSTEIRDRIQDSFMRNPSVMVFVEESRYRSVGVIGEVENPGFYTWLSTQDTVLDAISLAGGTTADSAPRAVLIPGANTRTGPESSAPLSPARAAERGDSVVVDFTTDGVTETSLYLSLPLRPGDVVVVPRQGSVLVSGWVLEPGAYPISDSGTVLGAIAAAGGAHFAANQRTIAVRRDIGGTRYTVARISIARISQGLEPDVALEEGDIVDVGYSLPKVAVYGVYNLAAQVIRVGFRLF